MSWRPVQPEGELLTALATRDFGARNASAVVEAWRDFDRAMDHFPLSAYTIDFGRGPFGIGFAQPLVLDPRDGGDPRYVTDLFWTHPFGAEKCLLALRKMEQCWQEGVACARAVCNRPIRDAYIARKMAEHRSLGQGILCMIRTAVNMVRFFSVRDEYLREASSLAKHGSDWWSYGRLPRRNWPTRRQDSNACGKICCWASTM